MREREIGGVKKLCGKSEKIRSAEKITLFLVGFVKVHAGIDKMVEV